MALKIQNAAMALVLFGLLIGLIVISQNGIRDSYSLEDLDKKIIDGANVSIGQALNNINIVQGINQSISAAYDISAPEGATGSGDILGSLAAVAIGTITVIVGLLTTPFEISSILHTFYSIPPILTFGIITLLTIGLGFIILKMFTGGGDI